MFLFHLIRTTIIIKQKYKYKSLLIYIYYISYYILYLFVNINVYFPLVVNLTSFFEKEIQKAIIQFVIIFKNINNYIYIFYKKTHFFLKFIKVTPLLLTRRKRLCRETLNTFFNIIYNICM